MNREKLPVSKEAGSFVFTVGSMVGRYRAGCGIMIEFCVVGTGVFDCPFRAGGARIVRDGALDVPHMRSIRIAESCRDGGWSIAKTPPGSSTHPPR